MGVCMAQSEAREQQYLASESQRLLGRSWSQMANAQRELDAACVELASQRAALQRSNCHGQEVEAMAARLHNHIQADLKARQGCLASEETGVRLALERTNRFLTQLAAARRGEMMEMHAAQQSAEAADKNQFMAEELAGETTEHRVATETELRWLRTETEVNRQLAFREHSLAQASAASQYLENKASATRCRARRHASQRRTEHGAAGQADVWPNNSTLW